MAIYYTYDKKGFATGQTRESDKPLSNGSLYPPPEVQVGSIAWHDGMGWRVVPDLQSEDVPFEQSRDAALTALNDWRAPTLGDYSPAERATFDAQYAEAKVVLDGGEAGPYLKAIEAATGEPVEDLALKVVEKREAYDAEVARVGAHAQKLRNQISAATSAAELPTYLEVAGLLRNTNPIVNLDATTDTEA